MSREPIEAHGGTLINRVAAEEEADSLLERAKEYPRISLNPRTLSDLELIAVGAFSPLTGYMTQEAYQSVVHGMRLPGGIPWTLPVTLAVDGTDADRLKEGEDIALLTSKGETVGLLHLQEKFTYDKAEEARNVYKTEDEAHPGVRYLYGRGDTLLGGDITLLKRSILPGFEKYHRDPAQLRAAIGELGWDTVAAFQTRNPIHRAHEYLQKCVLEFLDGLMVHPLVGKTKLDDIPSLVRMECYQALLSEYYPTDRVFLSVFPGAMRYAGPREAVFHALVRKNYGCTHFIVGRDHAGVGNYYGSFDAQLIFQQFDRDEIDIRPIFFDHSFYCLKCESMASSRTCPHGTEHRLSLSGTRVREMIAAGEELPREFTRPEVARILQTWASES